MRSLIQNARKNGNDEPAHLVDGNRPGKEACQNAGLDKVTDHGVGTGGDYLVALLNSDGAAPVAAEALARPDGEQKAGDGDGSSPSTLRDRVGNIVIQ